MKSKGDPKPFPIVAIGASAGGLEAISQLLQHLSPDLGMAYVVIQHLSPSHESILPDLLEKKTRMKVFQVEDEMEVRQDCVFVIPPNAFMSIVDGKLTLEPRHKNDGGFHSIDFFLNALAAVYQNNAIAVILSGTATDGTAGIRAIKAEGGITFAQDETAKFTGMPHNAADSGFVDFVMSPDQIAKELATISKLPYMSIPVTQGKITGKEKEIRQIHAILHTKWQVDFSNYKQTTILRRILRRMALNKLQDLEKYSQLLKDKPSEVDLLYKDLLINVTSFFREPALYEALVQKIFPALFKDRRSSEAIRIWIPACSSGEEACSIAICLYEYLGDQAIVTPIQIFATDLSESAIEKARAGIYTRADLQNVSPHRLQRFFTKVEGNYQIIKPIRDICVYATHNLLKDPPFSRIDLISCQNVLIYLETGAQKRILRSFHYALKSNGYLLLGKSEALGSATELFSPADKIFKLFSKKTTPSNFNFDFSVRSNFTLPGIATDEERMIAEQDGEEDIEKETNKLILAGYTPAGVTVNKEWQIVHFHGDVSRYLRPNQGKASLHLLKMVRDELVFELRTLLQRVKKEAQPAKKEAIPLDKASNTSIEVIPLRAYSKHPYYLILFRDSIPFYIVPEPEEGSTKGSKKALSDRKVTLLQRELKEAREHMKAMSEEFEAVREELQSANEEILSSNEELQSINEELETSKEELQSANEELTTINDELHNRNSDLKEAVDYTEAVIQTIREPLVVLNDDLRIRTANNAFYTLFKLKPETTEGYYFYEAGNGLWNIPTLRDQLSDITSKNKSFENFEIAVPVGLADNKILLFNAMRMNLEKDSRNRFLLAIEDITERRRSEETIRQSNIRYATLISQSTEGICRFEMTKPLPLRKVAGQPSEQLLKYALVAECNDAMARMYGRQRATDILGSTLQELLRTSGASGEYLEKFIAGGYRAFNGEISIPDKQGNVKYYILNLIGIIEEGELRRIWALQRDITERMQIEDEMKKSEERFRLLVQNAFDIITIYSEDGTVKYQSESLERVLGYHPSDRLGTNVFKQPLVHPEDIPLKEEMFRTCKASPGQNIRTQFRMQHKNGQYRVMEVVCTNLLDHAIINGLVANFRDVTEKYALEKQKEEFIGIASHELKTPITSIKGYTQILRNALQESDDPDTVDVVDRLDRQVNRLTNLVRDLLDVTKLTGGQLQLAIVPFDINELISEIVEENQQIGQHHQLITELEATRLVHADRERTGQILTNFLSNAIKYSPDADKIVIRSRSDDQEVIISIQDFGFGISPEVQEQIFQQFFRVHHYKMNAYPGLGLGLYIAAQLIRSQGGRVWVDSVLNQGSVFHFALPAEDSLQIRLAE